MNRVYTMIKWNTIETIVQGDNENAEDVTAIAILGISIILP